VSSNLCVAVPDGATELERLRDRNQGIAPPSNADLIAIIRAKDDLICQLKTAALETDRLRDRVEQLEQLVGVDRSLTSRLRTAFGLEPGVAQVMGMLLKRDFVTHDALYVVLYAARPECDWPDARIVDVQISRLRRALRRHGITIKTQWGEGWLMSAADKARVRAVMDSGDAYVAAVATGTIASMRF
jgi:hypothetical protein